jgi:hypothetical protein
MLPKNVFQRANSSEEENKPTQDQPKPGIRPPFAPQVPQQRQKPKPPVASNTNIPNEQQKASKTGSSNTDSSDNPQEQIRRTGYFTYDIDTINKVKQYMESIEFDNILIAFPLTYLISKKNKMHVQIISLLPGNLMFNVEQIKTSMPEKIYEQIENDILQYGTKINLTLLNHAGNPRQKKSLEQNGLFGLNKLAMHEFIPVLRDTLLLYATGQIKNYQVPMYLPVPIGVFASRGNSVFDTTEMELRLCGNYLMYLHYSKNDDLLYLVLNEISPDCKNGYSDMLRGMTIFIPIEKLSAMFLSSTLKDF